MISFNKRGQLNLIRIFFIVIIFIFIWAFWLGQFLNEYSAQFLATGYVTGLEAFLWANLNLWIALGLFLGVLIALYSGGAQR